MTSDTKIGLLLGLVFIFVIAFLINGLPSLQASANSNELTYNMVNHQADTPRLATKEKKVGHYISSINRTPAPTTPAAVPDYSLPALDDAQAAEVRFRMPLPTHNPEVARSAADVVRESQPVVDTQKDKPKPSKVQVYQVQSGDNLAKIAQRFYGKVVGNKLATVDALFNANRAVLASKDAVPAGVKLTIPIITGAATQVVTTKKTGPGSQKTVSPKPTPLEYTVKPGDSLWEIAEAQLGNGNRYKEIAKLNQTVLQGGVKVMPGMRLKLPTR